MHPNSLANLRPAWTSQPDNRSAKRVEQTLALGHNLAPKAVRLIGRAMQDEDQPMGLRLRCAEYIVDKVWPKAPAGSAELTLGVDGAEWLDVRFHWPSSDTKSNGHAETIRVSFDADGD